MHTGISFQWIELRMLRKINLMNTRNKISAKLFHEIEEIIALRGCPSYLEILATPLLASQLKANSGGALCNPNLTSYELLRRVLLVISSTSTPPR